MRLWSVVMLLVFAAVLPAQEASREMAAVAGQTMLDNRSFEYVEELADEIGGRITGSPEARRAVEWGVAKMKALGLANVHTETWQMPVGWTRGVAEAEIVAPVQRKLHIDSMGWVGSTPAGGVEAEVIGVNVHQLEQELKNTAHWRGKALLATHQGNAPSRSTLIATITRLMKAAAEDKAVAVIGSDGLSVAEGANLTHTGDNAVFFCSERGYCDIPVVSMVREHHLQLERMLARGQAVRIRINVQNQISGPVQSANVVGEIRGREHPEQVVVVGAHLDSWDLGQGAIDDGFGVASVLAAAEGILRSGSVPRRTIRFVLFTGEEQGLLGSRAYVRDHAAELENHLGAVVIDSGQGPIMGLSTGRPDLVGSLGALTSTLKSFGSLTVNGNTCGTDCLPFIEAGLPGVNLLQLTPDFAATLHSAADSLDKVDPAVLARDTTVMALTAYWIADQPERWATRLARVN